VKAIRLFATAPAIHNCAEMCPLLLLATTSSAFTAAAAAAAVFSFTCTCPDSTRVPAECTSTVYRGLLQVVQPGGTARALRSLPGSAPLCGGLTVGEPTPATAVFSFDSSTYPRTVTVSTCNLNNTWATTVHVYFDGGACCSSACQYSHFAVAQTAVIQVLSCVFLKCIAGFGLSTTNRVACVGECIKCPTMGCCQQSS
jgi:hypothetical protein